MTASNSTTTFAHTSNLNGDHRSKGVGGRVSSTSQKIVCRTTTKILEEKLSIANKKIQLLNQSVTKLQLELVHYKQYFASMYLNNSMNHNTASSAVPISIVAPVNMASVEQKIDNYIEQSDDSDPSIAYFEVSCALKVLKSRVKQARTQSISFQPENTACNITRGEFEKLYDCHRIQEFLGSATKILNNRLQPGFAKNGTNLHLGQCPFYLFNYFMSLQSNCKHTTKVFHPIRDGVRVNVTKHYYRFNNTLPDFGSRWHIRDHGNVVDWSAEMRSMYQSIVLIINEEDDRVTCKYSQVSQFKFCDRWIDTA